MFHLLDITLKPRQDSSNSSFGTLNVSELMKTWIWVIICCMAFSKERKQGKNRTEKQLYPIAALWVKSAGSLSRKVGKGLPTGTGKSQKRAHPEWTTSHRSYISWGLWTTHKWLHWNISFPQKMFRACLTQGINRGPVSFLNLLSLLSFLWLLWELRDDVNRSVSIWRKQPHAWQSLLDFSSPITCWPHDQSDVSQVSCLFVLVLVVSLIICRIK